MTERAPFYARAEAAARRLTAELAAQCPELEATAVVCLWKLPDQRGVPAAFLAAADGGPLPPDALLRLAVACLDPARDCLGQAEGAVARVLDLARRLAREGRPDAAPPQGPQEGAGGAAP
jgi:hypothetical protein